MIYEFEGKTEREAIELAAQKLGLDTSSFDVEIIESQSGGLFKKGKVRILQAFSDRLRSRDSTISALAIIEPYSSRFLALCHRPESMKQI